MGKIFKDCKQCGARYLTCHCEVVSKDGLSKLVDRWLWDRGDIEGLDRYTIGVVARSFQKLLKKGE